MRSSIFRSLFLVREIHSSAGVLHFQRWRILNLGLLGIYVHKIFESDQDHPHSHPWSFWTLCLSGGYDETRAFRVRKFRPGNVSSMSTFEFHTFKLIAPTTTLVLTGRRSNPNWGHIVDGKFVEASQYRANKRAGLYPKKP